MINKEKLLKLNRIQSDRLINKSDGGIDRIIEIINRLTDETYGCPWDKIQTNSTLAKHTIEEAYEVTDSIENKSPEDTCKELGDLLFNILFHVHIASKNNQFNLKNVIDETVKKMVSRHPHVFQDKKIQTVSEVNKQWEEIKRSEKSIPRRGRMKKELNDISVKIPALTKSMQIQKKAANVGFDWNASFEIINKIYEEIDEFINEDDNNNSSGKLNELGDILFSVVNLARFVDIDPETALRSTNQKFVKRLIAMEKILNLEGKEIVHANKKELNSIWQKIKYRQ